MLRANQEVSSKLRLTIACCVLTSMICAQAASAATIFFDDFNDGNAGDGMPVTWVPGSGTWDASSGDYVATGSLPRVSRVPDHVLGDTSARTQARVVGNIAADLAVRRPRVNQGYAGVIRPDGSMAIARLTAPVHLSLWAVRSSRSIRCSRMSCSSLTHSATNLACGPGRWANRCRPNRK